MSRREQLIAAFEQLRNSAHELAAASLRSQSLHRVGLSPNVRVDLGHMSVRTAEAEVVDQMNTGTCWLQAAAGFASVIARERGLKLRLSVPHMHLFDKLDKARVFLKAVTSPRLTKRQLWHWQHDGPVTDGGTWGMFVHLLHTYGVVPHDHYLPTYQAEHTALLNRYLNAYLRSVVRPLRAKRITQEEVLARVRDALVRCYSVPPSQLVLNHETHGVDRTLTPLELAAELPLRAHVVLCHAPDRPLGRYCGPYSNDPDDDDQDTFVCVPFEQFWRSCIRQLRGGRPVWFTAEIDYDFSPQRAVGHPGMYLIEELLGLRARDHADKAERMHNHNTAPRHAMLLTAVHVPDDVPETWRVQNSWGKPSKLGDGFLTVTHEWFAQHVFQVAIDKRFVDGQLPATPLRHLPPWDIFATVAQ